MESYEAGVCWTRFPSECRGPSTSTCTGLTPFRLCPGQVPPARPVRLVGDAAVPCDQCRDVRHCTIFLGKDGLMTGNYCVPCSTGHGRCSFGALRVNSLTSRGTAIGVAMQSLSSILRDQDPPSRPALEASQQVMTQVISLLREVSAPALHAMEAVLGPSDKATRLAAAFVVDPYSVAGRHHPTPPSAMTPKRGSQRVRRSFRLPSLPSRSHRLRLPPAAIKTRWLVVPKHVVRSRRRR